MALTIGYSKRFLSAFRKLEQDLQEEILEKVELLKEPKNHKRLKVHKLSGALKDVMSFSVNYRIRITFTYVSKKTIAIHTVGTHDEVY
jgi:mRNA-degrading endonuclease YafQ of YafQ-DinJ toxin-antitoxin module